ncbi:MAG: hypothetical protein WCI89_00700 [bacterium]
MPPQATHQLPTPTPAPAPTIEQAPTPPPQTTPPTAPIININNNLSKKDFESILLPKKEIHAPENAQRVSAGTLAAQEQFAKLPKNTPPETSQTKTPPKERAAVTPLQTYKGDVENYVRDKNVSVVSAAAAQARRTDVRSMPVATIAAEEAEKNQTRSWGFYAAFVSGGVVCILAAAGLLYAVLSRTGQLPVAAAPQAPFIVVDGVVDTAVGPGESREAMLAQLKKEKEASTLSLGLIEHLRITVGSSTSSADTGAVTLMSAQQFLSRTSPTISANLLRTLGQEFLLGAHTFETRQPFLILKTDSYEQAFAGMLAWEGSMHQDLSPLFDYTPPPHVNGSGALASTATSTTADTGAAQNTNSSFTQNGFVDAIVENHDARVLKNPAGDIYFLWTFLDRTTIVITTQEYTLREVISRLKDAPLTPTVGQ